MATSKVKVRLRMNGNEFGNLDLVATIVTMQTSQGTSGPRYVRALPARTPLTADEVIIDFQGEDGSVTYTLPAP